MLPSIARSAGSLLGSLQASLVGPTARRSRV